MGKQNGVFCKSAFTAMSLTATVKHITALQGGTHSYAFPHNGCHRQLPSWRTKLQLLQSPGYVFPGWHHTIYKKRKMALEFLEDRPPPSV